MTLIEKLEAARAAYGASGVSVEGSLDRIQRLELGHMLYQSLRSFSEPGPVLFGGIETRMSSILPDKMGIVVCSNGEHVIIDGRSEEEREESRIAALKARGV